MMPLRVLTAGLLALGLFGCEPVGEGSRVGGEACAFDAHCVGGVCSTDGFPGGMCTDLCANGACSPGFACTTFGTDAAAVDLCLPECAASGPQACRDGYVCNGGVCTPDCRRGFDCGALVCNQTTGACADTTASGELGSACTTSAECATGFCQTQGPFTGGMCTLDCSGANCPDGSACASMPIGVLCMPECSGASDCRDGYVCRAPPGAAISGDLTVCLPCVPGTPCG